MWECSTNIFSLCVTQFDVCASVSLRSTSLFLLRTAPNSKSCTDLIIGPYLQSHLLYITVCIVRVLSLVLPTAGLSRSAPALLVRHGSLNIVKYVINNSLNSITHKENMFVEHSHIRSKQDKLATYL